jgi:hypothetical protein
MIGNIVDLFGSFSSFFNWAIRPQNLNKNQHHLCWIYFWHKWHRKGEKHCYRLELEQIKGIDNSLKKMETVEEQCNPLKSVNAQQIIFAINYSLGYLEWIEAKGQGGNQQMIEGKSPIDKLVQHYRCGTLGNGLKQIIFGAHRFAQNGFTTSPEEDQLARKAKLIKSEYNLWILNGRWTICWLRTFYFDEMSEWPEGWMP